MATSVAVSIAALIAIFGEMDETTWITVVFTLIGLIPWVLEASGVRLHPMLFLVMAMLPVSAVVLVDRNPGGLFPAYIAVVWITQRATSRIAVVVSLLATAGLTVGQGIVQTAEFEGTVYFLGGVGIALFAGLLLRRQERLLTELQQATERERVHAAIEERTRIAREVHDVIAHSLTVTILHVSGARRALANDPRRATEALERAEAVGRESLDSIRQVVGLLRSDDGNPSSIEGVDEAPLPQFSDIATLVSQYREAGLNVDASIDLEGVSAGAMTSLTAFRLVQEAMTNSLQHAPGAPVSLRIGLDEDGSVIRMEAENPVREVDSRRRGEIRRGLGLTGMVERVRASGGSIEAGPTTRGTWLVTAELPVDLVQERS